MKDKAYEEITKGGEAEKILSSAVYQEAFTRVKTNIIDAMQNSPLSDDVTHNRLVIALQTLNQIERALTDIMQTGKMAKIQVNDNVK